MLAELTKEGRLTIKAETQLEAFALGKWFDEYTEAAGKECRVTLKIDNTLGGNRHNDHGIPVKLTVPPPPKK